MSGLLRVDEEKKKQLLRIFFWVFFGINLAAILKEWLRIADDSCRIGGWGTTEFLVNFQGGYVRRGLLGEILHYFCVNTTCSPNYIIIPLCLCSFMAFAFFMFLVIKKLHFCWFVLLTNYGIFGAEIIRKDYMIFLSLIAALLSYSSIKRRTLRFFVPLLIIIVMLHLHEASFFYCVPVYLLVIFSDKTSAFSFAEKAWHVALITITMGVLCFCKGDKTVAHAIVNSWQVVYPETYGRLYSASIKAIGWDSFSTFCFHLRLNFVSGPIRYSGFLFRPVALMVILFLMVRVGLRRHIKSNIFFVDQYIYISLILLLTLMPMLTVLSCDFRRAVFYWVISSILTLYYLQNRSIFLMNTTIIQKCVGYVRDLILKQSNRKTAYLLLLIFEIPYAGNAIFGYRSQSLCLIMRIVKKIVGAFA